MDLKDLAEKTASAAKKYVAEAVKTINEKVSDLENRISEIPAPKEISTDFIKEQISILITDHVSQIPVPQNGAPGEKGEKGDPGEAPDLEKIAKLASELVKPGADGAPGKDGADGKDGESVSLEQIRTIIQEEVAKIKAPVDGRDGRDGRDAIEMEILSMIDVDKTYQRGTYAYHGGGLWHSFKTTDGMNGWECLVRGTNTIKTEYDGERSFKITNIMSDGTTEEKEFILPIVIYKGIFKEGDQYFKGDMLTWAGSLWHCNKDTNERPGSASKDWQLAAKRGADGKDKK